MNVLEFSGLVGAGAMLAGFLGALTGLGGGVIIVPLLTIALGVDIRYAIGASLVSVIATSSGAAAAYVREGFTNLRVGMLLEIATTLALEPEMMLLDEPMSGLGQEDITRITTLIREAARERTVLMVEHNLSVVADLSQFITVLTRGTILAEGDYATVSANPEVIEAYMGSGNA